MTELGRRERHKASTRRALEDAALRRFAEDGYDQTSVEAVAADVDRTIGVGGAVVGAVVMTGVAGVAAPEGHSGPSWIRRSCVEIGGGCFGAAAKEEYACELGPAMLDILPFSGFVCFVALTLSRLPSQGVTGWCDPAPISRDCGHTGV